MRAGRLCIVFLFIIGVIFAWKASRLLPLYANGTVRENVKTAMAAVAAREGWLLSDMLVTEVSAENIRLTLRRHLRGQDPESCYVITLADSSLHPCE